MDKVGDTPAQCLAKSPNGWSDPPADSVMSKLKFPGTIFAGLSLDDKSGIRSIYGNFTDEEVNRIAEMKNFSNYINSICQSPCVIPQEDSGYPLSGEEIAGLADFDSHFAEENLTTRENRLKKFSTSQRQYFDSYGFPYDTPELYLKNRLERRNELNQKQHLDFLRGSRAMLALQIRERDYAIKNFKNDLDPVYFKFLESEQKMLIQIRRDIVNEIGRR